MPPADLPSVARVLRAFAYRAAILFLLAGASAAAASGEPAGTVVLSAADVSGGRLRALDGPWRFAASDDASLVSAATPDAGWTLRVPSLLGTPLPEGFAGRAVFRLRLVVPEELGGRPLALVLRQTGASEVYVDGRLVAAYGRMDGSLPKTPRWSAVLVLPPGEHLLAVRYVNLEYDAYRRAGMAPGFRASVGLVEETLAGDFRRAAAAGGRTALFSGVFLAFALLHLSLFVFHRELRENLWFALLCGANAALAYLLFARETKTDPRFALFAEPGMNVAGLVFAGALLLFVWRAFGEAPRRPVRVGVAAGLAALAVFSALRPGAAFAAIWVTMLGACAEGLRVVVTALVKARPGARLVGPGVLFLLGGFSVGLLAFLGVVPRNLVTSALVPFGSAVAMLLFTSIHLSSRFAEVNRALRARLADVERLSAENLEAERRARRDELSRSLLEAELSRKSEELEEARRLQTSMLPREVPQLPSLAAAARMRTATEVGGDYYDFEVSEDGAVTVAIGDATGHGLRAGTLVAATKGLFGALANEPELPAALVRAAGAIRRMNLRTLSMALTLARVHGGTLRVAAAGMPPVLVHRAATDTLEALPLAGAPLGAFRSFPYAERSVELAVGDTVLLMSDGLPERLNAADDELGYERTTRLFHESVRLEPGALADALLSAADDWASGRPADDDTTLVVLRRLA